MPYRASIHSLATVVCRAWLAFALFAWLAWPASVRAETTGCTVIDSVPYNILAPGNYCLTQDFTVASGYGIIISSDDVVVDCNHHRLRNTDPAAYAPGVSNGVEHSNLTVRNCVIEGFREGVSMSTNTPPGNRENVIENNTILRFHGQGIIVWGSGVRIEGNHISQALGDDNGGMIGIALWSMDNNAAGNVVRNNVITDFRPGAFANPSGTLGIYVATDRDTVIEGNTISGLNARTNQCTWGIYSGYNATGVEVRDNVILSVPQPVAAPLNGTQCGGVTLSGTPETQATNVCVDNVVGHFNTNFSGCVLNTNTSL
jgi:hypothetical protein